MEEKKRKEISLSTVFLVLLIIVIIIMGIFIHKLINDKATETQKSSELQEQVNILTGVATELQRKIDTISNTINTISTSTPSTNSTVTSNTVQNIRTNKTDSNSNNNNTTNNTINNNKEELIGKWNTCKVIDSTDGTETTNMRNIFGSSYAEFGSYLELKEDGSFLDAIQPVTDGSTSVEGSYTIAFDYYKIGDCYIFLNYSDGRKNTLQRVYYDESNTPYLVLDDLIGDYQISLKK